MPDIRPRRKSIPLVSELVSIYVNGLNYVFFKLIDKMIVSVFFSEICRDKYIHIYMPFLMFISNQKKKN